MSSIVTKPCQCEHLAHFDPQARTPNGNPGHTYGQAYAEWFVKPVHTVMGVFDVCTDCARDCYANTKP